jgi:MFS family permease
MLNLSASRLPWGLHYTWVIVAILATVQILATSISMAAGILVPPLTDPDGRFGWSVGTIVMALATYYVVGAVMLSLTQSISMVPLMASVSGWFRRRLGLGTGILWAAGGVGTAVIAPLTGYLLENYGWQITFWSLGIGGGGLLLFLNTFLRNRPADIGLKPYGAADDDPLPAVRTAESEKLRVKVFNQHVRRTRAFWNLPAIHGLGCAGHGIILIFAIPFAVEEGIGLTQAALILTIISLVSISSRLLTPILAERYGSKRIMASCLFVQGITVLILFWAHDLWVFYLFGALFGIGFGGEWTGYLVINRQYFGNGPMGTLYGSQMTGALMGHAITTALGGVVYQVTGGNYDVIFGLSAAFSLAGAAVILTLEPTTKTLISDWEMSLPEEARSGGVGIPGTRTISPEAASGDG